MSDFSFASHEDDPTDIAKNPTPHYLSGAARGAAGGALLGTTAGLLLRRGNAGLRGTLGSAGAGALVGAGAGASTGYHTTDAKRKEVERAYGAVDPFALQKLSSVRSITTTNEHLSAAYAAGYEFALNKLAAETAVVPATAAYDADPGYALFLKHPYAARAGLMAVGGLSGAIGGAIGGARHGLPVTGAVLGVPIGLAGGALGAAAGHWASRRAYAEREQAQGRSGELPFVVAHPYLTDAAISGAFTAGKLPISMVALVGGTGAAALHDHYKQNLAL